VEKEEQEEDVNKILIFENECVPHPIQAKSVSSSGVENEGMIRAFVYFSTPLEMTKPARNDKSDEPSNYEPTTRNAEARSIFTNLKIVRFFRFENE